MIANEVNQMIINVNCGKGISIDVDTDKIDHVNVIAHVWRIGLRNILMDSHANVTAEKFPEPAAQTIESKRRVEEKLADMMAGELTVKDGRTKAPRDPIAAAAFNIARDDINALVRGWNAKTPSANGLAWIKKLSEAMAIPVTTEDEVKSMLAAAIAKRAARADVMEKAAKTVAEQASIDLGDLI